MNEIIYLIVLVVVGWAATVGGNHRYEAMAFTRLYKRT